MLNVTIPWDLTAARVKMDFKEMERTAQVTVFKISCYLITLTACIFPFPKFVFRFNNPTLGGVVNKRVVRSGNVVFILTIVLYDKLRRPVSSQKNYRKSHIVR